MLSSLWTAFTYYPLLYSLVSPNKELLGFTASFRGSPVTHPELAQLVQEVIDSAGRLKRAYRVAAYYGQTAELKNGELHTSKKTQYTYLASFEKRRELVILVVTLTETDDGVLHFNIGEGYLAGLAWALLLPPLALILSAYWLYRKQRKIQAKTGSAALTPADT